MGRTLRALFWLCVVACNSSTTRPPTQGNDDGAPAAPTGADTDTGGDPGAVGDDPGVMAGDDAPAVDDTGPTCSTEPPGVPDVGGASAGPARYPTTRTQSPITRSVADGLRAIAARAPGANDLVFMKVGDSISASFANMSCFNEDGVKLFGRDELRRAICEFRQPDLSAAPSSCAESWCAPPVTPNNRASLAAEGGTTADFALTGSPSPLEAEVAATNPRYALVEFGTNDATTLKTAADLPQLETYFTNMLSIVDQLASRGVITVLYTIPPYIPPRSGWYAVPTFNAIVRGIAQGRQVPLVDFYRELLPLSDYGLWDGVHPHVDLGGCDFGPEGLTHGYNVRNLISMQALARLHAVITEGARAVDPSAGSIAGDGSSSRPFVADSLPFADMRSLRSSGETAGYPGCVAAGLDAGELYYRVTVAEATRVRALALETAGEARVFVLSPDGRCLTFADDVAQLTLSPGAHTIVVDAPASDRPTEALVVFVACDAADPTCD